MKHSRHLLSAFTSMSLLLAAAQPAMAEDKALAESLFQEGKRLLNDGKAADACPKFEASQKADPSPGTLLNLAKCYEALGRTASAWAEFKSAEALARNLGRTDQQEAAAKGAAALEGKLSKLELMPPATKVEGLKVTRDGQAIGVGSLGTPFAVDPGKHEIRVSAPGYREWATTVDVGPNGDVQLLRIPPLTKAPEGEGSSAGADLSTPDKGSSSSALPYVLLGGGGVFIGAGLVFGLLASGQASDAENDPTLCPDKACTPAGQSEIDSAETKALISTIGVGVGAAAAITGLVLLLTQDSGATTKRDPKKASRFAGFTPAFGPRQSGLYWNGSF